MADPITDFRGKHDFLSNFYPSPVTLDDVEYPTVEHAFQAAKTPDFAQRRAIRQLDSPGKAKRAGRKIKRREDWFDVSLQIMESLIHQKFTRYPELGEELLATGDVVLIEGNNWDDKFYGCVWNTKTSEWEGENHLGKILMKTRQQLRQV
jgi:ribA/ribD-fused uncharacterized protein